AADGHGALLHSLEQRGLGLRRGAVDLVREEDMGEDRPLLELEVLPAVPVLHDDVRADDVGGHQVGRELDPREGQLETFGERLDQECLAETGHTLQQDVTAGKHARQDVGDDLAMADDDLLDLRPQRLERGHERLHASVLTHRALLSRTIIRVALPMRIRKSPETTVKPARRPPLAPPPLLIVTPRPVQCARHFLLRALAEQVTVAFDLAPGPYPVLGEPCPPGKRGCTARPFHWAGASSV